MLDATVGGPASNSYVTLEEAQAYMATNMYGAAWLELDEEVQEQTLMMATIQVDSICYLGQKATAEQSLKWPRTGLTYDGHPLPSDIVPREVKIAVCEQAKLATASDPSVPQDAEVQGLEKVKAGSVEVWFHEGVKSKPVPSTVSGLIPQAWRCPTPEELAILAKIPNRRAQFAVI